ncbi:DUF1801 domain-containing protein [Zobellia roscoffensis]|uniref:DUF1801 domain-containing protein n=1 Tax=Zobellia roscoffensis TaxID=2779508 RepID=UPI00188D77C2|nr:DUF1801 domain-containing protein [Zobellia roscoffensis]
MNYKSDSPEGYIEQLPPERQEVISKIRDTILSNLPSGFHEQINYGMLGYVVPHSIYPDGYHCDPKLPLPFINLASQKNFIALYHSGIYANPELYDWFVNEYPKHCKRKLDMGKSCIRFKSMTHIPYELIATLCQKMTVTDWIQLYEKNTRPKK